MMGRIAHRAARLAGRLVHAHRRLGETAPLSRRAADPAAIAKLAPADVCIIGSGVAGGVLGLDLVRRGWRVVIVESAQDQRLFKRSQYFRNSGEIDYPFSASRYRGFGGSTVLWRGGCPRLRPIDFRHNAYTPPGAEWPVGYSDLEPFYDRAERSLEVRHAPIEAGADATPSCDTASRLERAGIALEPAAIARPPEGSDRYRVARDLLPHYCSYGDRALLAIGTAIRLTHADDGRISSVVVEDRSGMPVKLRATVYVVACGGLETPRLLLSSRSASFPLGIGNRGHLVGRYFMEHMKLRFGGALRRSISVAGRCFYYYDDFKERGLGSPILAVDRPRRRFPEVLQISADVEMYPSRENRVTLDASRPTSRTAMLALSLSARDLRTMRAVSSLIRGIYERLGATAVAPLSGQYGRIFWLSHHMGTCRMGNDPANSVVDADLRLHDSPNLYIAGSAPFVTGGGSNPTLTIAALSHRLADHLHERLAGSR
ncbi:GMC oxidoreductase [soil metagenome]